MFSGWFSSQSLIIWIQLIASVMTIVLFYVIYDRAFVFQRPFLYNFKSFFLGLILSAIAIILEMTLFDFFSDYPALFAAAVEEFLRFLLLFFIISRSKDSFTVTEGIFIGVLVGLGFAFAENIHYSTSFYSYGFLLRNISAVPMHVFATGIMAYYLSYRHLTGIGENPGIRSSNRRLSLALRAFLIPFVYHYIYDTVAISGKWFLYLIPILLIPGFIFLEYFSARGRKIFAKNILFILNLDADRLELLERQKDYETWMSSFQKSGGYIPSLFINHRDTLHTIISVLLIIISLVSFIIVKFFPNYILPVAEREAIFSLVVVLPLTVSFLLLISDKINYSFFRDNMLRLPGGILVEVNAGGETFSTIILEMHPAGAFITEQEERNTGDTIIFKKIDGKESESIARVVWSNSGNATLPVGTLVEFQKLPLTFHLKRIVVTFKKIQKRIYLSFISFRSGIQT